MLFIINAAVLLPAQGVVPGREAMVGIVLLLGLGGGFAALIAVIRSHESSWLVWIAMLPGLTALVFFTGELLHKR